VLGPLHIVSVRFGSPATHITQSRIAPPSIATPLQYNTAQANVSYMMFQGYPATQMTKTVNNTARAANETKPKGAVSTHPRVPSPKLRKLSPRRPLPTNPTSVSSLLSETGQRGRPPFPALIIREACKMPWRIPCHTSKVYEAIGAALSPTPTWDTDVNTDDDAGLVSCVHMHSSWLSGRQIDR
jgi:hypothetical protein